MSVDTYMYNLVELFCMCTCQILECLESVGGCVFVCWCAYLYLVCLICRVTSGSRQSVSPQPPHSRLRYCAPERGCVSGVQCVHTCMNFAREWSAR